MKLEMKNFGEVTYNELSNYDNNLFLQGMYQTNKYQSIENDFIEQFIKIKQTK